MKRFECLKALAAALDEDDIVVTNVGPTRSEWESLRPSQANLYQAGMGNVIPISLGLSLSIPRRRVVALDGDGSCLLNPGCLATVADEHPRNLMILIFDNECYEATGGQPTATARLTDLEVVARGFGVGDAKTVRRISEYRLEVSKAMQKKSMSFVIVKVERGGPFTHPTTALDGRENKYRFKKYIEWTERIRAAAHHGKAIPLESSNSGG